MEAASLPFDSLDEPLRSSKLNLLKELKDTDTTWKCTEEDPIPDAFLRACRLYHLDHLEVYFCRAPRRSLQEHLSGLVSPQNELRVLTFLRKTLASAPTSALVSSATARLQQLADSYLTYVLAPSIVLSAFLTVSF